MHEQFVSTIVSPFYISLICGLILLNQDPGVGWLGIHVIMIVMTLTPAEHNRFAILKVCESHEYSQLIH